MVNARQRVVVSAEYALFTRPETKVERMSYPMMTPSAARAVMDAICRHHWHWIIRAIWILSPIQYFACKRNELNTIGNGRTPIDANEHASPRAALFLKDASYLIEAEPWCPEGNNAEYVKAAEMFDRRVKNGQCFSRPYLGTRECAADFRPATKDDKPQDYNLDLGMMLFDIDFETGCPIFFPARVQGGVLTVDPAYYKLTRKGFNPNG